MSSASQPPPEPPDPPLAASAAIVPSAGDDLPRDGRLLGVDFGLRRIGLAISTPEQTLSCPLETWQRHGDAADARRFRELFEDYRVVGIVVGLPLHMSGDEGESARLARRYGAWLKETLALPVGYWDERCSSAAADEWMLAAGLSRDARKHNRDRLAAHVILQSYLDARRRPA